MITQSNSMPRMEANNALMPDIYCLINELPEWVNYLQLLGMRGEGEEVCLVLDHNLEDFSHNCLLGRKFDLNKIPFTRYDKACLEINENWTTIVIWKDPLGKTSYKEF